MRVKQDGITDAQSPDHALCEHCGMSISWDDVSYTHDHTGFADCDVVIEGGEEFVAGDILLQVNPEIRLEGNRNTYAEPTTWFTDVPVSANTH